MSFSEIIDHADTITLLKHYIGQDKVPHAVLLHGTAGIGKSLIARQFARAINCDAQGEDSCDKCPNCVKSAAGYHPDLFFVRPESRSGAIMIEQIRDMQNRLYLKPFEGRRKVCIIEDAHAMNDSAANALLKTLEEPPATSHIFLVSDKPHNLLQTILSRCHKIHCRPIAAQTIEAFLRDDMGLKPDEAHSVAVFSDGSLGKARAIALGDGIYGASGLIVELLLETKARSTLFVLEKISQLRNFLSGLYDRLEKETAESLETGDGGAGMSARDRKALAKEIETQAKIKASAMLVEEMNKLLHFAAFVLRDMYMAQNGRAEHIANKAFADRITSASKAFSGREILDGLSMIERLRADLVFNMSPQDAAELLFLKLACRPA